MTPARRTHDGSSIAWFIVGFDAGLWLARQLIHYQAGAPAAVLSGRGGCVPGCRCGCNGPSCACHG